MPHLLGGWSDVHDVIRRAERADAAAIASLNGELGYVTTAEEMAARLDEVRALGRDEVFVAEYGGAIDGWVHVAAYSALESGALGEIRGLVVTARRRGGGVGARLVRAAEQWARERGMPRLRVRTRLERERAHRFYEREGFALLKQQRVCEKPL